MIILVSIILAIIIMGLTLGAFALAVFRLEYFITLLLVGVTLAITLMIYSGLK